MRDRRFTTPRWLSARPLARVVAALALVLLSGAIALAQTEPELAQPSPPVETKPAPAPATPAVAEVRPQVFYLKDKSGELLLVGEMTYEEWKTLYDLQKKLTSGQSPPDYGLRSLTITGDVDGTKANLDVELTVEVHAKDRHWLRIPWRFNSAILRDVPKHQGSGEFFVQFDAEADGYVCWLKADEGSTHTFRCQFIGKVQEVGAESRLALTTPRAVKNTLNLTVPLDRAEGRYLRRSGEEQRLEVTSKGGKSTLQMLEPSGEFQLAWRAGATTTPQQRQVLEATTGVLVKLEGKRRITCESRIKVRSLGAPMESFRVRLPPDMRYVSIEQPKAQLSVLEPELDPGTQKLSQIVEVRLTAKTNGPIEIPIVAELLHDAAKAEQPIEVGGFEVIDAVKQWGTVDLAVEGDQSAIWVEGANIRRIDDANVDPLRANRSLAMFEFDAQPFTLQVQVVPKRTRVSVEPTYVVYVDSRQVRIDATLKYKIRGAKTYKLEYDFRGWTIDRVGPENLVQSEALLTENAAPLAIPLAPNVLPVSGEFELRVQAHRELAADSRDINFEVPQPLGAQLAPGAIVVVPADNVELTPHLAEIEGLTPDPLPSTVKLPLRQQSPLFYRELSGAGMGARFVAGMQVRDRTVTVAAAGDVQLDAQRAQVEERLTYNIAYEPLRNLELDVPRELWEAGQMQVLLDGSALPVVLQPADDAGDAPARATVRVDLLSDRIGRLELAVRYTSPIPKFSGDRPQVWSLPLVLPRLDGVRKNASMTLRLTHDGAYDVNVSGADWTNSQRFSTSANLEHVGEWTHAVGDEFLPLQLAPQQAGNQGAVVVDQIWLQTWLTHNNRQDRAVFRVTTSAPQLRIQLPPQTRDADLEVAVNGHRSTAYVVDAEGVLTIELPRGRESSSQTIELWYEFNNGRPALGKMELAAPLVKGSGDARRAYWQLVLPDDEHVIVAAPDIAADMAWRWNGVFWAREGNLSQHDLETWCSASQQADLPEATRAYLFSTFGPLQTLEVRTELRRNVLLGCSGLALVLGLALLYLPAARHPAMLLIGGVAVATLALWSPDLALIAAQAAVVGVVCVLLARLLSTLFGTRRNVPVVLSSPSHSGHDHKSTEPHVRQEGGSQATTATVGLASAGSPLESQP